METTTPGDLTPLQPTPDQAARLARFRRSNLLFVYIPIAVLAVLLVGLVGWLIWRTLIAGSQEARTTQGAIADIILMLTLCPLMLLCATGPAAAVALIVRRRQAPEADTPPVRPEGVGWLHAQLWRLDNIIDKVAVKIADITDAVAAPFIALRARLTFVERWLQALWERLQRPWGH